MKHLEGLNNEQKNAVLETDGPLLIIAGAGAGKTKTLTHRVLHLIKHGIPAHEILAITFTNKASKEMRERIDTLLEEDQNLNLPLRNTDKPFVSTFHALGVHILREQAIKIGLIRHFSIYDRNDSKAAVKKAMKKLDYDPKEHDPGKILNIISREKGDMVTHIEYEAKESSNDFQKTMVTGVWREYETILKEEKALDFDDLLLKTALLLKNDNDVRNYYQNKWKYFLIDEYQDTNEVQYNIIKMLAAKSRNICVVGDIDQNIYSWRGATIKNILHFEKDYPEAKVITLEQNYRSTKTILEVANEIIELNKNRRDKNLFTENDRGDKITLYNAYNENDESRFVSEKCDELIRSGVKPNDIAVLYRANFQSHHILTPMFQALLRSQASPALLRFGI
jgi:DNA helicase-2/ATP-dependent DNA helicase PcrA